MIKIVIMSMVAPNTRCADYEDMIRSAVQFASHNLALRHHIEIENMMFLQSGDAMLQLSISDKDADKFRPGARLKGIGQYLLKRHPDIFRPKLVGTRLFSYEALNIANFVEKVLMIKLDIADYCETCPYFDSETKQDTVCTDGVMMHIGDTVISCKNAKICQYLAKQLSPEQSKLKDTLDWIYGSPLAIEADADMTKKIEEIEKALGFKLFVWQKYYLLTGEYRMSGLTTADIFRELVFKADDKPIDFRYPPTSKHAANRRNTLIAMKKKLDAAGVKTREVIFR